MFKRTIKYKDFDGNPVEEVFYFNLSSSEILEMEAKNIHELLVKIVETEDREGLVREIKNLILTAYGEKSDDGKRFIKTDEVRTNFSQTAAFEVLFLELVTDENAAAVFANGIMPQELLDKVKEMQPQDKPAGPPPVPKSR